VAQLLGRCHLECSGHVISDLSWFTVRMAEVGTSTAYAPGDEVLQVVNALSMAAIPRLFRGAKDLCWGAVRFKKKGIGLLDSDRPPALSLAPSEVPTTTAGRETRSGGSSAASSSFEL
jgi:hypothetical protein